MSIVSELISRMQSIEAISREVITLVPSENLLSPLARTPFLMDLYSRYSLDDLDLFGHWVFQGGRDIGEVEHQFVRPMLSRLCDARHVSCKPISGLQGMWVALSAVCNPGDVALILPASEGGHACTGRILQRAGIRCEYLPFEAPGRVDLKACEEMLIRLSPSVVYVDQSTFLFPLDVTELAALCRRQGDVCLYVDTSHSNGLIFGGVIPNPLHQGAHGFGGSTHKTFPGPHKATFATNCEGLSRKFNSSASDLISHAHGAEVLALALTLAEFEECGGPTMVQRMVDGARILAEEIWRHGVPVLERERNFTACHQMWVPAPKSDMKELSERFFAAGLHVNLFHQLPNYPGPSFRLGTNEVARLGFTDEAIRDLAGCFVDCWKNAAPLSVIRKRVKALRAQFSEPTYCMDREALLKRMRGGLTRFAA